MFFKQSAHLLLLLLGYSLGIFTIYKGFIPLFTGNTLIISLAVCTILLAYFTKTRTHLFWIFCFVAAFLMGSLRMEIHPSQRLFKTLQYEGKQKNTLETINPFTLEINGNKPQYYQFVIESLLKSNGKQYRYVAEIHPIQIKDCTVLTNNHPKTNPIKKVKVLLSHAKDSLTKALKEGQVGIAKGYLNFPSARQLPGGFSYKNYLRTQDIHFTFYMSQWKKIETATTKYTFKYRSLIAERKSKILEKLQTSCLDSAVVQVYSALVFGEKTRLDPDLRMAYQNAGAAHILAISGLHIGMIAAMLLLFLAPLQRLAGGKILSSILLLFGLWTYAIFSGSAPSVVRAVSMFSFLSIAWIFKRPMFSLHYLAISFFFMLLWNPLVLFSLGFVMSYAAVASILLGMPLIESLGVPKNKYVKKVWQLASISLLAQLGVLGPSLFSFHQFPLLFLATNLFIIPWIGILLGLGIFTGIWWAFSSPPNLLLYVLNKGFLILNNTVEWIGAQDQWILKNIYFPTSYLWALLLLTLGFLLWQLQKYRKPKSWRYFLCSALIFQSIVLGQKIYDHKINEHYIIKSYGQLTLLSINHKTMEYYSEKPLDKNTINSFKNNYDIRETIHKKWENNYQLGPFKIVFPKIKNQIKGPISHVLIDSSTRAYPSHFKPEQLSNTRVIYSGFYPTKEMNTWEKWARKNGRLIWKIDTQGFYDFKRDISP